MNHSVLLSQFILFCDENNDALRLSVSTCIFLKNIGFPLSLKIAIVCETSLHIISNIIFKKVQKTGIKA